LRRLFNRYKGKKIMKQKLYAAYGSNLHLADMRQRCPQAVRVGHALLGGEPSIYPAWRRTQVLSRLAASPAFISLGDEPSVYLAWQQTQCLSRLATNPAFISLGDEPSVCLTWRRAQCLSRLAAFP